MSVVSADRPFDTAYRTYLEQINALRARLDGLAWMDKPGARDSMNYMLLQAQSAAFMNVIGPKRDFPMLPLFTFQPLLYSLSNPSADFVYRFGFVDGSSTYRLSGLRNDSLFVDIQVIRGMWGSGSEQTIGSYEIAGSDLAADGTFEFILSAEKCEGNWIKLDPSARDIVILIREVVDDWDVRRAEFDIERVQDGRAGRTTHDEAELARRLELAGPYMRFLLWDWGAELTDRILREVGANAVHHEIFGANPGDANNPAAIYPGAIYDLGDDEAIVIETNVPDCRYWNVQLCDPLWSVIDFTHHQSSLNNRQAQLDEDGKLRVIISQRDPCVPNWLDPVDNPFGVVLFRFYAPDSAAFPQVVFKGSLELARAHLPSSTPTVTPEDRRRILSARTAAARKRFAA